MSLTMSARAGSRLNCDSDTVANLSSIGGGIEVANVAYVYLVPLEYVDLQLSLKTLMIRPVAEQTIGAVRSSPNTWK